MNSQKMMERYLLPAVTMLAGAVLGMLGHEELAVYVICGAVGIAIPASTAQLVARKVKDLRAKKGS